MNEQDIQNQFPEDEADNTRETLLEMLRLSREIFMECSLAFLDRKKVDDDAIRRHNRQVSGLGADVRKRLIASLGTGGEAPEVRNIHLLNAARDIEQLTSAASNILRLSRLIEESSADDYYGKRSWDMLNRIEGFFSNAQAVLLNAMNCDDTKILKGHSTVTENCDDILSELLCDQRISARQAIAVALVARSMKRVSNHLKNIACPATEPSLV